MLQGLLSNSTQNWLVLANSFHFSSIIVTLAQQTLSQMTYYAYINSERDWYSSYLNNSEVLYTIEVGQELFELVINLQLDAFFVIFEEGPEFLQSIQLTCTNDLQISQNNFPWIPHTITCLIVTDSLLLEVFVEFRPVLKLKAIAVETEKTLQTISATQEQKNQETIKTSANVQRG